LDDKFGSAEVPGRTAMSCALKELMKPFAFSGFKYYFEVEHLQTQQLVGVDGPEITNSKDLRVVKAGRRGVPFGCIAAKDAGYDILAVSSPFQVLYSDTSGGSLDSVFVKYKTRICIWQSREEV